MGECTTEIFQVVLDYIGNRDVIFSNGGYVPCNGLTKAFVPKGEVGVLVRFSGYPKYNLYDEIDPVDPLYLGIDLTFIEIIDA